MTMVNGLTNNNDTAKLSLFNMKKKKKKEKLNEQSAQVSVPGNK